MEKKQKRPKEYIGITEAAEILGVSYASVRDNVVRSRPESELYQL